MMNANNCKYLIIGTIVILVCVVLFSNNNLSKPCLNCGDNNEQQVYYKNNISSYCLILYFYKIYLLNCI